MDYTLKQARPLTTVRRWVAFPLRQGQTSASLNGGPAKQCGGHGDVGAQSFGSHPSSWKGTRITSPLCGSRQPGCRTRRSGFYIMPIVKTYEINWLNIKCRAVPLGERGNAFIEYFVLAMIVLAAAIWFFDGGQFQGVRGNVETTFTGLIDQVAK